MLTKEVRLAMAAAVAMTVLAGCAGLDRQSDEEIIRANVSKWADALAGEPDLEAILEVTSPDFYVAELGGKEALAEFLSGAIDEGYLDGGEVFLDDMTIEIDEAGENALVGPIDIAGASGEVAIEIEMAKSEDGDWLIVSLGQY